MKAPFKKNLYFDAAIKSALLIFIICLIIKVTYDLILPGADISGSFKSIKPHLWLIESTLLLVLFLAVLTFTSRYWFSLVLTCFLYFSFITINIFKIKTLGIPLVPIDLTQIDDLVRTKPVFLRYLPYLLAFIILATLGTVFFVKHETSSFKLRVMALSFLTVIVACIYLNSSVIDEYFRKNNINLKKNTNLVNKFSKNGYLNYFSQAVFFYSRPIPPEKYSNDYINEIIERYQLNEKPAILKKPKKPDNIILILAESFIDPSDYGWKTSPMLLKNFNSIKENTARGKIMVPVFGGKSINTEFELLTGMTNRFTPVESLPFRELVSNNTPGIARSLKIHGFTTNIIQAVKLSGFGFEKIYDYIGIDNKISLVGENVKKDPTGLYASSESIAAKITALTASQDSSFIYAFANSSHMPWKIEGYPNNQIKIENNNQLNTAERNKLLAYFNALQHVDSLLGELVSYYEQSDENTIILFAGDHLPALPSLYKIKSISEKNKYIVPAVIWSNYLPLKNNPDFFLSMNFVASYVLELAGAGFNGFMKLNQIVSSSIPVLSHYVKTYDTELQRDIPSTNELLIEDYKILQYHILMKETVL